jgi:hypothetical protein
MTSLFAERERVSPKWREGEIFLFFIHEMRVEEKNDGQIFEFFLDLDRGRDRGRDGDEKKICKKNFHRHHDRDQDRDRDL